MIFSDDPLADLLSDNSLENDSFFDNPTGIRTTNRVNKGKNKLDDLFGIKEESESTALPVAKARQPVPTTTLTTSTPRTTNQQQKTSKDLLEDDDDDDLGFDPQKPKAGGKLNLLDDLFASSSVKESKRPATAQPTSVRRDTDKPTISRQSTDTTTDTSNVLLTQPRPKTSAGRRSSSASNVVTADPLGLFGGATKEREKEPSTSGMSTPKARKRGTTADWLGLDTEAEVADKSDNLPDTPLRMSKPPTTTSLTNTASTARETVDILKLPDNEVHVQPTEIHEDTLLMPPVVTTATTGDSTAQNILLLNTHNLEMKNAYTALQQQESQLALATQMKNQERALLEMQRKQETLLQQQERQFQALVQQQLQRQQQMEDHIKMQQQRINSHIQLLMTQPALLPSMPLPPTKPNLETDTLGERIGSPDGTPEKSDDAAGTLDERRGRNRSNSGSRSRSHSRIRPVSPPDVMLEAVQHEADIKRLELEKLRLEELVANQKVNYEREIELIERSYKKQLEVVENHTNSIETRLKLELEELTKHYTQKVETLENEKQKLKSENEADYGNLKQDHEDELRKLKKSHEDDIEMLREEHRRMLENVRQAKMLEFAAVQENGSYMEMLKAASSNLENLSGGLQGLRDDVQTRLELLHKEKEKKLEARERRLEDAERRLKMNEESADEEKKRLMTLVSSLEQQLNKLSKESADENWLLRQRMAALEAEKTAFEKEKEFAREQIARDEKRLEELKERQLVESQRALVDLQEERARLYLERTKIETEQKLHSGHDMEKQRLEMDAVMKVAQDAARQADVERERYHKSLRQLEQYKRELIDKENTLRAKEDELQQETLSFRMAEHKSQEALQKARTAEQNFQMKMQLLQKRMREIDEMEVNLSQERMAITQERIKMQQLKTRLMEKRCEICKMGDQREKVVHYLNSNNDEPAANDDGGAGDSLAQQRNHSRSEELKMRHMLEQGSIVDRMLDENIAESLRRMRASTHMEYWPETVLDDDAKELALHNFDGGLLGGNVDNVFTRTSQNKY
ncbi:trichohyalin [Zeugodacus cucurbitae]|uniref:Fas-binding factor 1 n=1 Tax=Zeugodacus cucurbitae TaxID=28588 RepID=A0A0A1X6U4_ZEUCU|nr:trichohyalin [Zeugodacus cucurbitae]XP_054084849.1 trichohyalin [Zeugodacus cucurbitae]XP_054084850.1 trichohyalin [Zeugodacus cucurbitae]